MYLQRRVLNLYYINRGILSLSWCSEDPDLLISCGKDNRLLIWNPSCETDENLLVCELEHNNQWNFEVSWCPRDPLLITTSSFDGQTTVYSLNDLQNSKDLKQTPSGNVNNINSQSTTVSSLTNAPKWLRRNSGASFAFGGNLVSFDGSLKTIQLNKIVTESDFLVWSEHLRKILNTGNYEDFCHYKSESTPDDDLQLVWKFLKTVFQNNAKDAQLDILGYTIEKVNKLGSQFCNKANGFEQINTGNNEVKKNEEFHSKLSNVKEEHTVVAKLDNLSLQSSNTNDLQGAIYQSLLIGNLSMAADLFLDNEKPVEALLIAITDGPETLSRIQNKYLKNSKEPTAALLHAIVTNDWSNLVENCNLSCWKEVVAALLTHTNGTNLVSSFEKLGNRLAVSDDVSLSKCAQICYICSGNVEALIDNAKDIKTIEKLQECVEMAILLHKSMSSSESHLEVGQKFGELLVRYSETLVSQGDLEGALTFLEFTNKEHGIELKNQLCKALGKNQTVDNANNFSQKKYSVGAQELRKYSTSSATGTLTPEPPFPSYPNKSIQDNDFHQNYRQPHSNYLPAVQPQPIYNLNSQLQSTNTPQLMNNYNSQIIQKSVPPTPPPDSNSRCVTPSNIKPGKARHVVHPSVKGNNAYGGYNNGLGMSPMVNNYPQPLAQQSGFNPSIVQQSSFNPPIAQQSGFNPSIAQQSGFNPPIAQQSGFNLPMGQQSSFNSSLGQPNISNQQLGQPNMLSQPLGQSTNFNESSSRPIPPNIYNPTSAQMSNFNEPKSFGPLPNLNPPSVMQPTFQPIQSNLPQTIPPSPNFNQPSSFYNQRAPSVEPLHSLSTSYTKKSTPGWNDPPMLSSSAPVQKPPTPVSSTPITHPMYTNNPPPIEEVGTYIPLRSNNDEQYLTNNIAQAVEALPKQPLPQEHVKIQIVLEGLQSRLLEVAPNAQTRKKVSDIARKLELLYDSLRENSLSSYLTQCLHAMIDFVLQRDYNGAFNIHTQLVSGPEFSKISTFMPSLKALFQMTYQYNISVEGL